MSSAPTPAELLATLDGWLCSLCNRFARQYRLPIDDLLQVARLQVLANADKYDPFKGMPTTWAFRVVLNAALAMRTREAKHDRATPTPPEILADHPGRLKPEAADPEIVAALAEHLDALPPAHRDVVVRRFGLDGRPRETLMAVAAAKNLSRERIRQIEASALFKLRVRLARFAPDFTQSA